MQLFSEIAELGEIYCGFLLFDLLFELLLKSLALVFELHFFALVLAPHPIDFLGVLFDLF